MSQFWVPLLSKFFARGLVLLLVMTERENGCSGPGHPPQDTGNAQTELLIDNNQTFHGS